jgi:hypothetical protein
LVRGLRRLEYVARALRVACQCGGRIRGGRHAL